MDGSHFKIVFEVGAGGPQRRAAAQRRGLASLASEPARGKVMIVREVVIEFDHAIEAVAGGGNRAEEIIRGGGQAADQVAGPETTWANELGGESTLRNAMGSQ